MALLETIYVCTCTLYIVTLIFVSLITCPSLPPPSHTNNKRAEKEQTMAYLDAIYLCVCSCASLKSLMPVYIQKQDYEYF